jgi:hypothetical protein
MTERTLFLEALEIADPSERLAYLGQACAGDAALRRQLESLLAAHDRPRQLPGPARLHRETSRTIRQRVHMALD